MRLFYGFLFDRWSCVRGCLMPGVVVASCQMWWLPHARRGGCLMPGVVVVASCAMSMVSACRYRVRVLCWAQAHTRVVVRGSTKLPSQPRRDDIVEAQEITHIVPLDNAPVAGVNHGGPKTVLSNGQDNGWATWVWRQRQAGTNSECV